MSQARPSARTPSLGSRCYRLTAKGRVCVEVVQSGHQTAGALSPYLHDVLMMCGTGIWFHQLRRFMPPRSQEDVLQALMALELIEIVAVGPARERKSERARRATTMQRWLQGDGLSTHVRRPT